MNSDRAKSGERGGEAKGYFIDETRSRVDNDEE